MGTFDVIVVGAGPAGSVCAHDCARSGIDTLLLERATFPRDKPCGGMVDESLLQAIPGLEGIVSRRVTHGRTFLNGEPICEHPSPSLLFTRTALDEHLALRARRAGADLRQGVRVRSATTDRHGVTVTCSDGTTLTADLLVDATGAKGGLFEEHKRSARDRLDYKVVSLVIEAPCPNEVLEERLAFDGRGGRSYYNAYLETGFVGYGWVFPKDGLVNVGLGTITTMGHGLRRRFAAFLERTGFGDLDPGIARAGLIPVAILPQLWLPRVMFAGDAGGFVNPLTGGGLVYGMRSGALAALTAREALEEGVFHGRTLEAYEGRCAQMRRELGLRTTALYYLAGAVKRHLDRPFAVRLLLRTLQAQFD